MSRKVAVVLAFALLFAGGGRGTLAQEPAMAACSLPGLEANPREAPTDAALLTAWNAQSARVRSVEATVAIQGWSGAKHSGHPSPAHLAFRAPVWLRATGNLPFSGKKTFDLLSNGQDFWLLVPDGKLMRLFEGPVDAPAASKNASANLRPRPLVDALYWQEGSLSPRQNRGPEGKLRTVQLDLPAETPFPARTAAAAFDLANGVVQAVAIRDGDQRVVLQVGYSEWQPTEDHNCYPRHIEVEQPLDDRRLDIRIGYLHLNDRIASQEFRMIAPLGAPVTHLANAKAGGQP